MRDGLHPGVAAANFLAAKTVTCATAFLDGSCHEGELSRAAAAIQAELMTVWGGISDLAVNAVLDPVRLLVVAMMHAAMAPTEPKQDRWRQVMGALVELVNHESVDVKKVGALRA